MLIRPDESYKKNTKERREFAILRVYFKRYFAGAAAVRSSRSAVSFSGPLMKSKARK
jgi:hypothetical protein